MSKKIIILLILLSLSLGFLFNKLNSWDYLSERDITPLDEYVIIGRAPGNCKYKNSGYSVNSYALIKDIVYLKCRYNVDTIIDLRNPVYEGQEYKKEKDFAELVSINYINLPMDSAVVPTNEYLDTFFNAIKASNGKTYIHCHQGRDRTGLMSLCYLTKTQRIDEENAFKKVFDSRNIERLRYMKHNKDECNKLSELLKSLK